MTDEDFFSLAAEPDEPPDELPDEPESPDELLDDPILGFRTPGRAVAGPDGESLPALTVLAAFLLSVR